MDFSTYLNLFGVAFFIVFCHYFWLIELCKHLKSELEFFKTGYYERLEFEESMRSRGPCASWVGGVICTEVLTEQDLMRLKYSFIYW